MLNQGFLYDQAFKSTYENQTQQLYALSFEKFFPLMSEYLVDQRTNYAKYSTIISEDNAKWVSEMKKTVADTAGE